MTYHLEVPCSEDQSKTFDRADFDIGLRSENADLKYLPGTVFGMKNIIPNQTIKSENQPRTPLPPLPPAQIKSVIIVALVSVWFKGKCYSRP